MTRRRTTGTLPPAYGEPARDEDTFRLRVPPPRGQQAPAPRSGPRAASRSRPAPAPRSRAAARSRVRRRQRSRRRVLSLAVLVLAVVAGAALLVGRPWLHGGGPADAAPGPSRTAPETGPDNASKPLEDAPDPTPPPTPTPTPTAEAEADAGTDADAPRAEDIPASGPGTFTVARAGVTSKGKGSAYRVEVEDGIGVDPDRAAADIAAVLADPRGWSHGGERSFRQVADGSAGLVIRIATPATTDRMCGEYGLNTRGEVNCRGGEKVMVNLKRWQLGSPQFDGPVSEYRALIVNHEVGHWLGRGHETCPGKGRPAPAMMQQIDGLKGCVANAWPYDGKGRYLGGPKVP
ncbi:DUF3152 domain-containing protein [Streptomyces sp. CAI-121]|uniref:DUF3152 domain-containing protein n=1 Tax=unclassified Streptomyces TaxID=2593676 RepID=UPI001587E7CE|nr:MULTISPECIES: DUF3152 domain-containing protein [unclassified Streptomyces]NUV68929.1 DUF3152 domain-containing protein [Streptomyces sp. CAI-121]NUW15208.1 DUF3152 domain-containing protein [Streptomyces sp. CAI-68]